MSIELQLEDALKSINPAISLRDLVKKLIAEGITRAEISQEINRFHLSLMSQGRESDDDLILEVADALDGWCHPDVKLQSSTKT